MYFKIKEIFYLIGLALMILRALIENSNLIELNPVLDFIFVCLSAIFLGLKLIMERYTIKEFTIIIIVGVRLYLY